MRTDWTEPGLVDDLRERLAAAHELNEQLERALESRIAIEQAKGVLAERLRLHVDDAFELLRYAARSARMPLHDLAARVVSEKPTPNPVVVALARRTRWRAALMRERNEAMRTELEELSARVAEQVRRLSRGEARNASARDRAPRLGA